MKAILKFNMPEESEDFELSYRSRSLFCALWDIHQKFRQHEKYDSPTVTSEDVWKIIQENDLGRFF